MRITYILGLVVAFVYAINATEFFDFKSSSRLTPLHLAVLFGETALVKNLIDQKYDVNAEIEEGITPLYMAIFNNHIETIKLLLDHGSDSTKSNARMSPFHFVADGGNLEILKIMIDRGADVDTKNSQGYTALTYAVMKNQTAVVKFLLDHGSDSTKSNSYMSPFHHVAAEGNLEILKLMIDREADMEAIDSRGCTALTYAVINNQTAAVKLLLEHGSNPNIFTSQFPSSTTHTDESNNLHKTRCMSKETTEIKYGMDLLHHAILSNHAEIVKLLVDHGSNSTNLNSLILSPFHLAASEGKFEILEALIDRGADIDAKDKNGSTALIHAVLMNRTATVKFLLEHGSDPTISGYRNMTALSVAININNSDIVSLVVKAAKQKDKDVVVDLLCDAAFDGNLIGVKALLQTGLVDIDATTVSRPGDTALLSGIVGNQTDTVKFLIDSGADLNKGEVLAIAVTSRMADIVRHLLDPSNKIKVLINDYRNNALLHVAAKIGDTVIGSILISAGYNVNRIYKDWTPLHHAIYNVHLEFAELLLSAGANCEIGVESGCAPFMRAVISRDNEMIRLLLRYQCKRSFKSEAIRYCNMPPDL